MRVKAISMCLVLFSLLSSGQESKEHYLRIDSIEISGNKRTKTDIILNELDFKTGDTIKLNELPDFFERNENNLLNTSLFNFVSLTLGTINGHTTNIIIIVEERWYFWPEVYFAQADRNLSNWLRTTDFSRVKYGFGVTHYNFRGKREKLNFRYLGGFVEQYAINYNNIILNQNLKHYLSIQLKYDKPNKMVHSIINNAETVLKHEENVQKSFTTSILYTFRPSNYINHSLYVNFTYSSISDTIFKLNPQYLNNNSQLLRFPAASYGFEKNRLNSRHYPLKGFRFLGTIKYEGIGVESNQNLRLELSIEKAVQISRNELYFDFIAKGTYSSNTKRPFFNYNELGYSSNLRGFEYYVINGEEMLLLRNTLKYKLFPTWIVHLKRVPIPSMNKVPLNFYANIFADAGYVTNNNESYLAKNSLPNTILASIGIGVDLVTYYDRTLSFFYAYNSLNEGRFYFTIINNI
jgi:outer membrane protein assembly factor BamA